MASIRIIEEERGSYTGLIVNKHNGYYAGDFRTELRPTVGACHTPQSVSRRGRALTF